MPTSDALKSETFLAPNSRRPHTLPLPLAVFALTAVAYRLPLPLYPYVHLTHRPPISHLSTPLYPPLLPGSVCLQDLDPSRTTGSSLASPVLLAYSQAYSSTSLLQNWQLTCYASAHCSPCSLSLPPSPSRSALTLARDYSFQPFPLDFDLSVRNIRYNRPIPSRADLTP